MDFTDPTAYDTRTKTWTAGDQVASSDLNAIQDGIIDVDAALQLLVDELEAEAHSEQTATTNQSDSPAPDVGGAKTIWVERATNGTSTVTLDNSMDWRDRWIHIEGGLVSSTAIPGGANDDDGDAAYFTWRFYSRDGRTSAGSTECADLPPATTTLTSDHIYIYASSATGALHIVKNATADADKVFVGRISGSPQQGHY